MQDITDISVSEYIQETAVEKMQNIFRIETEFIFNLNPLDISSILGVSTL